MIKLSIITVNYNDAKGLKRTIKSVISQSYHNFEFPAEKLIMLGAKTTCKDRWRQVLNEADRIDNKHLFTLQRGVSRNQLQEMKDERLTLVIPKRNKSLFLE